MGGGPSRTRKLTLENEDSTSVIKVSEDVVQRLKGIERGQAQTPPVSSIVSPGASWPVVPGSTPLGVPQPYFYEPPLTSLQIRQEKEAALAKNDQYWEKRVTDLEKIHGQMHQVMEAEYQKAMQDVKKNKVEDDKKLNLPPCQLSKKAVMDCYMKYPREPMKCSKEVEAFAECVDVQRATLVAKRG